MGMVTRQSEKSMRRLWTAIAAFLILMPSLSFAATCVDILRTLSLNTKGADVSSLQQFLRDNAGYTGAITGNFGPLTRAAVGSWQIQKGVVANSSSAGYGTVGPKTRAALACTKAVTPLSSPLPTTSLTPSTSSGQVRTLSKGMSGADVTALQTFLIAQGFLSATATGYFGPLTEAAVKSYQRAQNIIAIGSPKTTGYGAVGPRTRAALNSTQQAGSSGQATVGGTSATPSRPSPSPIFTGGGGGGGTPTPPPRPPTPSPTPTPTPTQTPTPVTPSPLTPSPAP